MKYIIGQDREQTYLFPISLPTELKFSTDIQPIFTENCIICHNGSSNPDLREGNAYTSLVPALIDTTIAAESTTFYVKISTGTMFQEVRYLNGYNREPKIINI